MPDNRLKQFLPALGPIIGLIGVTLAIYFHSQAVIERVLTYYAHPARAKIVDITNSSSSELQILHRGQPVGNKNITAVIIYIWNDGRMPIRNTDVLEALRFELQSPSEILEARVLKQSRDVVKFLVGPVQHTSPNTLPIAFEILEKSDGAAIQIIYSGNPDAPIFLRGTVVGVSSPKALDSSKAESFYRRPSLREAIKNQKSFAIGILVTAFVLLLIFLFFGTRFRRNPEEHKRRLGRFAVVLGVMVFIVYSFGGGYLLFDANRSFSPGVPTSIWLEE